MTRCGWVDSSRLEERSKSGRVLHGLRCLGFLLVGCGGYGRLDGDRLGGGCGGKVDDRLDGYDGESTPPRLSPPHKAHVPHDLPHSHPDASATPQAPALSRL